MVRQNGAKEVKILLLSSSSVIYRLIELGIEGMDGDIIAHTSCHKSPKGSYDIAFIDDKVCLELPNSGDFERMLGEIIATKKVLFTASNSREIDGIDELIEKPFLPSTIKRVIKEFVLENGETKRASLSSSVLDPNEISEIKRLLVADAKALNSGEEYPEAIAKLIEEESQKGSKVDNKREEISTNHSNPIVDALLEMKPKKLRQLLKGAKITIKIKFPKEEQL